MEPTYFLGSGQRSVGSQGDAGAELPAVGSIAKESMRRLSHNKLEANQPSLGWIPLRVALRQLRHAQKVNHTR